MVSRCSPVMRSVERMLLPSRSRAKDGLVARQRDDSPCSSTDRPGDNGTARLRESESLESGASGNRASYAQREGARGMVEVFAGEEASDQAQDDPNKIAIVFFSCEISINSQARAAVPLAP